MTISSFLYAIYNFFINELLAGYLNLRFRRTPAPKLRPLPPHIARHFIPSKDAPNRELELLVCQPLEHNPSAKPILFLHGCFGHASVWLEWMTYLREHGYGGRTYALSLRGHGGSWLPSSWLRMVWGTTHEDMLRDVVAGIEGMEAMELPAGQKAGSKAFEPILVGHSAGGELLQCLLAQSRTSCVALGLIGTIPHFGADPVFDNWAKYIDPMVNVRLLLHATHPKSNISTPQLMQAAYFGPATPLELVTEFGKWAPDYEAMRWPFATLGKKGKDGRVTRLNLDDVVRNIGSEGKDGAQMVLVLNGQADRLMTGTADRVVAEYRQAFEKLNAGKSGGAEAVSFVEIARAGHHVQNDVQREEGAAELVEWLRQL